MIEFVKSGLFVFRRLYYCIPYRTRRALGGFVADLALFAGAVYGLLRLWERFWLR